MRKIILVGLLCLMMTLAVLTGCQAAATAGTSAADTASLSNAVAETEQTTILGQVTAIEGNRITLALGTQGQAGSDAAPNSSGTDGETPPDMPSGGQGKPSGDAGTPPEMPSGDKGDSSDDVQSPPEIPSGKSEDGTAMPQDGVMPGGLDLTGEEQTITITDETMVTVQNMDESTEGSVSDIAIGSILQVTVSGDTATAVVVMKTGGAQTDGAQASGSMQGSSTGSIALSGVYTVDGDTAASDGESYASSSADENTVLVSNGGALTMTNAVLDKTGDSSSADESNFYGLNAVFAAAGGSTAEIADTTLTSSAEGSNAIFATGEGTVITADNVTIYTTGDSSRGLDATYGGTINASNVDITTKGAHCAPIATDRGEGTITVNGGTVSASGDGSPCIYSTGDITAADLTGTATGSQIAVVEGKNAITLDGCTLTGAGKNGIMLYQSTSGDAAEGTACLTATDSTLTTTSDGPMFYITNTDAEATITNTTLTFGSGILVNAAGNDTNNWGTPGSNGGIFKLTGVSQTFEGDITCDAISSVTLVLTQSSAYTGAVNADNTAMEMTVSLDADSIWTLTGDCYVTALANDLADCGNIISNGYSVYYDASNDANAWLDGETVELPGGGILTPVE